MSDAVDPNRFLDFFSRKVMAGWAARGSFDDIPWTPLSKPLGACRVGVVSSAGLRLKDDQPFDQERERREPWWGDPTLRRIPADATADQVTLDHLHVCHDFVERDLNCLLPTERLRAMAGGGKVGAVAPTAYGFMGYLLDTDPFLEQSVPSLIDGLRSEEVDLALFFLA